MKVLLSAYACEPHKGSEPGVGWNWAKQIARFAETWVITRKNNREIIEEKMKRNPDSNLHFLYYDVPKWLSFWKKRTRGLYLYYFLWQIGAYRLAKTINKQEKFDIVHHLTFGNLWLPTFMPFLNIPFIWGPIGGGEQVPKDFRSEYSLRLKLIEVIRDAILYMLRFNLLFIYTSNSAKLIIAKTRDTANRICCSSKEKVIISTDVAVNPSDVILSIKKINGPQIIAVGRLDAWRGFDLLIKAVSKINGKKTVRLRIVGEGIFRKKLEKIREKLNLIDSVILTGQVKHEEYFEYLRNSSIFVNPNLKEGSVTVLFDALLFGLPVICLDVPGSSEIVTDESGIKIKPVNPEQTISDLADALLRLADDSELRRRMGERGRKLVMEYHTWEKKGAFIRELYKKAIKSENLTRP